MVLHGFVNSQQRALLGDLEKGCGGPGLHEAEDDLIEDSLVVSLDTKVILEAGFMELYKRNDIAVAMSSLD